MPEKKLQSIQKSMWLKRERKLNDEFFTECFITQENWVTYLKYSDLESMILWSYIQ